MNLITLISDMNHCTVEACILIEAGQLVDESALTDENSLHEMMQVAHMQLFCDIPSECFESEAIQEGGKAKNAVFTGKTLWRQQKEVHKSGKNLASEMPGATSFHCHPSGLSLRDAFKKLICKKFAARKGIKKVCAEVLDAWDKVPVGWWMEPHSIVFALALMVHQKLPTVINVAALATPRQTGEGQHAVSTAAVAQEHCVESIA